MKKLFLTLLMMTSFQTFAGDFTHTVSSVNLDKFFKKWYVIAGRLTALEKGAHNAIEEYKWNAKKKRIDISFTMSKGSFTAKRRAIPQKGWIHNHVSKAHWKISPFWPLKFDYLIIDLAPDYSWTVVGVPNQKWVWIMADDWRMDDRTLNMIVSRIDKMGYNIKDIKRVPQKW